MENRNIDISITFVSNFINHHQVFLADSLYESEGINYHFVETEPLPERRRNIGYPDYESRPYVIKAYENKSQMERARQIIDNSDVVITGSAPEEWVHKRLIEGKVTFHYSERWLKRGYHSLLSPRAWFYIYKNHIRFRNKRSYMLCASAFTAPDVHKFFAYPNKCYKWGYFTQTPNLNIEKILEARKKATRLKILYVSRFLILKHPELPVQLARLLKDRGIDFELNMYGTGPELGRIEKLIKELNVSDSVNLCGNRRNEEILQIMREHHIFLFTSDRNEGWGAVVNEAMSNGCAVVASSAIGSVPFLIQDNINGLVFKDCNLQSLYTKTFSLIQNPELRDKISENAYKTMHDVWSPQNAAKAFIDLAKSALNNEIKSPAEGPCSKC